MEPSYEKRKHRRVAVKLPARLRFEPEREGVVVEVSNMAPGGIFVKSSRALPPDATVELRFRMLANRTCEARGRVAWQSEFGFGVAFDDTNDDMDQFTAQLLKLPVHLHLFYLADVLQPELDVI